MPMGLLSLALSLSLSLSLSLTPSKMLPKTSCTPLHAPVPTPSHTWHTFRGGAKGSCQKQGSIFDNYSRKEPEWDMTSGLSKVFPFHPCQESQTPEHYCPLLQRDQTGTDYLRLGQEFIVYLIIIPNATSQIRNRAPPTRKCPPNSPLLQADDTAGRPGIGRSAPKASSSVFGCLKAAKYSLAKSKTSLLPACTQRGRGSLA